MKNACPQCGAGAVRIDPLFITPSMCKEGVAQTYKGQILVSQRIYDRLSALGVNGLRQPISKPTREPISFWNLAPTATLPAWSRQSQGFCTSESAPPCSECRRDGFFNVPNGTLNLVYGHSPTRLFCEHDVLATWEHFGNSRLRSPFEKSIFAAQRLIVSDRVKVALENERGVKFIPVSSNQT